MPSLFAEARRGPDGAQHRPPRCLAFVCCEPDASDQLPSFCAVPPGPSGRRAAIRVGDRDPPRVDAASCGAAAGQGMEGQAPASNARGAAGNRRGPDRAGVPVAAAAAADRRATTSSSSSSSSTSGGNLQQGSSQYSSASSSVTSDGSSPVGGGDQVVEAAGMSPTMVLRGCPRCFMYVMVQAQRQRCPRCNTSALVRLFDG